MAPTQHNLSRVSFNLGLALGQFLLPIVTALIAVSAYTGETRLRETNAEAVAVQTRKPLLLARSAAGQALDRLEALAYRDMRLEETSTAFQEQQDQFAAAFNELKTQLEIAQATWTNDRFLLDQLSTEITRFEQDDADWSNQHDLAEASWRWFSSVDFPVIAVASDPWAEEASVVEAISSTYGLAYDHFDSLMAKLIYVHNLDSLPPVATDWVMSLHVSNNLEASSTVASPIGQRSTLRILSETVDIDAMPLLPNDFNSRLRAFLYAGPEAVVIRATLPFLLGLSPDLEESPDEIFNSMDRFEIKLAALGQEAYSLLEAKVASDVEAARMQRNFRLLALGLPALLALGLLGTMEIRRRRANDALIAAAETDTLTGLPNRLALQQRTDLTGPGHGDLHATLILMDIDNFKAINDTYGHQIGDRALVVFGRTLEEKLELYGQPYRLGGDEFVALMIHEGENRTEVEALSQELLASFSRPMRVDGHRLRINSSCGIATRPLPTTLSDLLVDADLALHEAKEAGKSGALHYRETRRGPLIRVLKPLLKDGRITFHFQPQVNLKTGEVCGLEMLCRWPEDLPGTYQPVDIIDSAEWLGNTHLFLLNLVARLEECQIQLSDSFEGRYWLNVWPSQLETPHTERTLLAVLEESSVPLDRIGIEITEKRALVDQARAQSNAGDLRAEGVAVALDDFGVYNASIHRLTLLPLDMVKLDQRLVQGIKAQSEQRLFVKALQEICTQRGLPLLAEGIEDPDDLAVLKRLGVDLVQGFVISPALDLAGISHFLGRWDPAKFLGQFED